MPFSADKVGSMLGHEPQPSSLKPQVNWDEAAHPVLPAEFKKIEILFHKIDDDRIAAEVARLGVEPELQASSLKPQAVSVQPQAASIRTQASSIQPQTSSLKPQAANPKPQEKKAEISFDEFKKLDLRVAQILSATKVEGADKLLRFEVDLGFEKRQIIASIAPWYPPESLVGRKIIVVANLAPAKIRGNVSQGMLLAAEDGGQLALLALDKDMPAGSQVR